MKYFVFHELENRVVALEKYLDEKISNLLSD